MAQSALIHCPICKKPAIEKFQPFCSARCANVDLGRWLGEKYAMPTDEEVSEIVIPSKDEEGI